MTATAPKSAPPRANAPAIRPAPPRHPNDAHLPLSDVEAFLLKIINNPRIHDEADAQNWRHHLLDKIELDKTSN